MEDVLEINKQTYSFQDVTGEDDAAPELAMLAGDYGRPGKSQSPRVLYDSSRSGGRGTTTAACWPRRLAAPYRTRAFALWRKPRDGEGHPGSGRGGHFCSPRSGDGVSCPRLLPWLADCAPGQDSVMSRRPRQAGGGPDTCPALEGGDQGTCPADSLAFKHLQELEQALIGEAAGTVGGPGAGQGGHQQACSRVYQAADSEATGGL